MRGFIFFSHKKVSHLFFNFDVVENALVQGGGEVGGELLLHLHLQAFLDKLGPAVQDGIECATSSTS